MSSNSDSATGPTPTVASTKLKVVLACFGDHKREVNFDACSSSLAQEVKNLQQAFLETFSDVLDDTEERNVVPVIQLKSEMWGGDIADDQCIPNQGGTNST